MVESEYPIRINEYGMLADTGGAGRYRGGLGLVREYGVVIVESGDDGARVLDLPATEHLRGRIRAAAPSMTTGEASGARNTIEP